jgi:hypothetical protein
MADQQPELLTLPPGNHNLQQPQQILKELPIQLDLFPRRCLAISSSCCRLLALYSALRRGFLFGNGIADAVNERDEESQIYGA